MRDTEATRARIRRSVYAEILYTRVTASSRIKKHHCQQVENEKGRTSFQTNPNVLNGNPNRDSNTQVSNVGLIDILYFSTFHTLHDSVKTANCAKKNLEFENGSLCARESCRC